MKIILCLVLLFAANEALEEPVAADGGEVLESIPDDGANFICHDIIDDGDDSSDGNDFFPPGCRRGRGCSRHNFENFFSVCGFNTLWRNLICGGSQVNLQMIMNLKV